jgi:hypothetical protein
VSRVLILLLVLLVLLVALAALGMATAMEPCPACEPGAAGAWGVCLAVLWALTIAVSLTTTRLHVATRQLRPLLLTFLLERPPRSL